MIKIMLNGQETTVIANAYCSEDKRYLLVSFKEYADFLKDNKEVSEPGPLDWGDHISDGLERPRIR